MLTNLSKFSLLRLLLLVLLSFISLSALSSSRSYALSGSEFQANRIIDDAVFFNGDAMTAVQIQEFLNSKVPTCDTNGTQSKSYRYNSATGRLNHPDDPVVTTSRATYGQRYNAWYGVTYASAPYICLKDYRMSHGYKGDSSLCASIPAMSDRTAAQIIDDVARACNVSQKALLVMLQKEQSLITDDWPWRNQYTKAMGYYCPDDPNNPGWCHPDYAEFFNQVYNGAKAFNRYKQFPADYNHAVGRTSYVAYQANSPGCGGTNITMQTVATAGLYNYTPYQPNAAALNNLYGTGDSCSAYGNRNFWRMFNDWFGSTQTNTPYAWQYVTQLAYTDATRTRLQTSVPTVAPGQKLYLTVRAKNNGFQTWDPSTIRLGTKNDKTSVFADSSWLTINRPSALKESSVRPTDIGSFDFVITAPNTAGTYTEYFNLVADGSTWLNDLGLYFTINVVSPNTGTLPANTLLASGSELKPGEFISSPEGHSILSVQKDGNLVLYENFVPVWDTKTPGKSVKSLNMQTDGNLVLYDINNSVLWNSGTQNNAGARLALQTDGNLVIYNAASTMALWSINRTHEPNHVNYVNTHLPVGIMYAGQVLETADRKYRLVLQTDGNLVLYSAGTAIWNSGTVGRPVALAVMQSDGNLVLYDGNYKPVWDTKTFGRGRASLYVQHDGNLVIYDSRLRPIWASNTAGR